MRYDPEYAVTELMRDFLKATLPEDIQATCPVVTFIDTIEVPEEAARFVVDVLISTNESHLPANFTANVELGVKSQWAQASIVADLALHQSRVSNLRTQFMQSDMLTLLQPYLPDGLALEYVQPRMQFTTRKFMEHWFESSTGLTLQCYATS